MRLTKAQRAGEAPVSDKELKAAHKSGAKKAARKQYEEDQKLYGPKAAEFRQARIAAQRPFDMADYGRSQAYIDDEVRHFDQLANSRLAAGDSGTAKYYTELADEAYSQGGNPRTVRNNEYKVARRASEKEFASRNTEKKSKVYGPNNADASWVNDVAMVKTAQMNSGTYDARSLGLFSAQATGKDVGWRGPRNEAAQRLEAYSKEIRDNVVAETPFGQSAVSHLKANYRYRGYVLGLDNIEDRIRNDIDGLIERRDSLTTIGADMSSFTPPAYFTKTFGLYRTFAAPLLSAAGKTPLPSTGYQVLLPVLNAPLGAASHVEGIGGWYPLTPYPLNSSATRIINGQAYLFVVTTAGTSGSPTPAFASNLTVGNTVTDGTVVWTNTSRPTMGTTGSGTAQGSPWNATAAPGSPAAPTGTNYFSPVNTYYAQATVPQQWLDRGIFGQAFDQAIARQAARELGTAEDADLLYAVLNASNIGAVTTAGSTLYSPTSLLADITSAAEKCVVNGTALQPTFIGAKSAVVRGFLKQVSSTGQPIFPLNPDSAVSPDGATEGYSGYNVQGARLNYEEQLADYESGSAIVLVGNPEQGLIVYESAPVVVTYPSWDGQGLTALVNVYEYNAYAVLYGAAFCTIEGSGVYGS